MGVIRLRPMRIASYSVALLVVVAGCQFDGFGVGERPGPPVDASQTPLDDALAPAVDAPLANDAAAYDAGALDAPPADDAGAIDAGAIDAGGDVDAPPGPPCLDNPAYGSGVANGHLYRSVTAAASWDAARQTCDDDGAYLVVIDDAGENGHVRTVGSGNRWIGLSDLDTEGDFVWVTGAPSGYRNWHMGSPTNSETDDCVRMRGSNGQWEVRSCDEDNAYICECDPDWAP